MKRLFLITLFIFTCFSLKAQQGTKTKYVFLIMLDGMRWQEVFTGADSKLI